MVFNYEALFVFALLISSGHSVPIDGNAIDEVPDALLVESGLTDGVLIEGEREVDNVIDLSRMAAFILRNPDNATGEALSRYSPGKDAMNPEELGSYYEGDMLVPKKDERNGLVSQSSRWADAVVPYVISGSFSSHDRSVIDRGMKEYHAKTCIRFKPRSSERDYIAFSSDNSGCWSSVGRIGGMQEVNLQSPGCLLKVGTFLHEVMHALGFLHEQNRYERDTYVDIVWSNIQSSTKTNFDKASSATTNAFGVPYDYGSVMHYSANAFSMNGRPTIIAKQTSSQSLMGQRDGFSMKDLQKLNSMYCYRRPSYAHTERPSQPTYRPTRPHYPQRPNPQRPYPPNNNNNNNNNNNQFPQRPYPPNYNNNNNNNNNNQFPFLSFLGNLVGSLIQGEEGSFNITEEPQIGQPRTIIPSETNA